MKKIIFGFLAAAMLTGTVVFASGYASCKADSSCPACCKMCCEDDTCCAMCK